MASIRDPATGALAALRERLAELSDLEALGRLAAWDQRTMMPPEGGPGRGEQMATLERIMHERATGDDLGGWLSALDGDDELGELDRDVVRLARRDWDRARRVPGDLAAEMAQTFADSQSVWATAREADDFATLAPALRRNVELARAYAACFDDAAGPYDALLADYDYGLTAERIEAVFGRLAEALPPMVAGARPAEAGDRPGPSAGVQRTAVPAVLARLGVDPGGWRIDVSAHPFSTCVGYRDSRLTTRYEDGELLSVLAAVHEFGHALYERQIPAELSRTNLGGGTSMSIHESQSKLWENHVARNPAFAPVLAAELTAAGAPTEAGALRAALTEVRPSLIRVSADQLTYPLHIVLRFELERALIEGALDVADLPGAWNDGMRRLLGVEVPSDAAGVMQDLHWAAGAFGYFPSYALGCLIAAQMWEAMGPEDEAIAAADLAPVREWLREHVHSHGRRLDTEPLVERATGRGVAADAFIRHATAIVRA
jgi:carboxypeptidase Taq